MNKLSYVFRNIPEGVSFELFGKIHTLIIVAAVLVSYFIVRKVKVSRKFELIIGGLLLTQQAILYTWYNTSNYNILKEGLPLYHCRLAILTLGVGLVFERYLCLRIGVYWGIFGAIGALMLPGLDPFAFPHITNFSYFIGHLLLLWGSIYLLFVKKIGFTKEDLKDMLIFTNIYHLIVFKLNNIIGSNYAYLRRPPFKMKYVFNPYFYAFLVMMVFNVVLLLEYLIMRKEEDEDIDECNLELVSL